MRITREFVEENKGKRFDVLLKNGVLHNRIRFFISTGGAVCFMNSRQRSRGRMWWHPEIESITEVKVKKVEHTIKGNAKKILNRLHENLWADIREGMDQTINTDTPSSDFKYHFNGKLKFKSMSTVMNKHGLELLKDAIENKKDYKWSNPSSATNGRGRDFRIECYTGGDGNYRAWFSSEYQGCLNGDYYLLLSPTTAVFYETD